MAAYNEFDGLNRNSTIKLIKSIITNKTDEEPMSFALEGSWGSGKTWIIENLKDNLINDRKCIVIHYNAWEYDYYDEPLFAIINVIKKQIPKLNDFEVYSPRKQSKKEALFESLKILASSASKIFINGEDILNDLSNIKKQFTESQLAFDSENLNEMDKISVFIDIIKSILVELSTLFNKKIIFFVDELDRCTPSYAIKTLERIHHIFTKINSSISIISVDKKQLEQSVKFMFGAKTNVSQYLRKFIKFSIPLQHTKIDIKKETILSQYISTFDTQKDNSFDTEEFLNNIFSGMHIRDIFNIVYRAKFINNLMNDSSTSKPRIYFLVEMMILSVEFYKNQNSRLNVTHLKNNAFVRNVRLDTDKNVLTISKYFQQNLDYTINSKGQSSLFQKASKTDYFSYLSYAYDRCIIHLAEDSGSKWFFSDSGCQNIFDDFLDEFCLFNNNLEF